MPKFWVKTKTTLVNYAQVEADSAEEALEFAEEDADGLAYRDYNGNVESTLSVFGADNGQDVLAQSTITHHAD